MPDLGYRRTIHRRLIAVQIRVTAAALFTLCLLWSPESPAERPVPLAQSVTIRRDEWGVPHIEAPDYASAAFGFAYAQAEDNYWQIEDSYAQGIGRYAELIGEDGLASDVLHHLFEVNITSRREYSASAGEMRAIYDAFAKGLNYFLETHPDVERRLIDRYEPWHSVAFGRFVFLKSFLFSRAHTRHPGNGVYQDQLRGIVGSNAWAIGPQKTRSNNAMLFANPHQPWFGVGQWYEAHIRTEDGFNFSGASFFGSPVPSIGHNEHLGYTATVNEPDNADAFIVTFDDPSDPLAYRYGNGHRQATEWKDEISVKTDQGLQTHEFTFRKTHHGPIVDQVGEHEFHAVKIARLYHAGVMRQYLEMARAKNLDEWKAAMALGRIPMFNFVYGDRDGNIFYAYNGAIPKREMGIDWTRPVDGSKVRFDWQIVHPFHELPQALNPPSGYLQNCNSSPFTVTDVGSPAILDYPDYMAEDRHVDPRRAKMSRHLLRNLENVTFEQWERLAFDTTLYWAMTELPKLKREFDALTKKDSRLKKEVGPYLDFLLDWDFRATQESTQTALCVEWYTRLYGRVYPAEKLMSRYIKDPVRKFRALKKAAEALKNLHGRYDVPWGEVSRIQRIPYRTDLFTIPFDDQLESYPLDGVPGPLGVAFTIYYTGSSKNRRKKYGIVGNSFMAVYEFGERIEAKTLLQFGQSGDPDSPHYFDQAKLLSERKFKRAWFYPKEVAAHSADPYHPGEELSPPSEP